MAGDNGGGTGRSEPTIDAILERMMLTNQGDKALLMKLVPWIRTQRPKFMYTSVLSIAVLLQRMARAFSMRSSAPGTKTQNATAKRPVAKTGTAPLSTSTVPSVSPQDPLPASSPSTRPAPLPPPPQPQQQHPRIKRKAFRSAKKLDLSPNVVASLKGFVADLAATIPLILEHAQTQQSSSTKKTNSPPLTAVDTIEVCLHMMEGEVATNEPSTNSTKQLPNAAMELYRKILDRAISNKPPSQDGMASTMDQLKFKTFCVKTLESAQSRTISVVESLHDFRLLWNVSHEQNALGFVPRAGTTQDQEELAWKLSFYVVWKRQEEHPNLCSRRERILAAATSLMILCAFPLLHQCDALANTATQPNQKASNANNKRPVEFDHSANSSSPSAANKVLRVASNGDVHQSGATSNPEDRKTERHSIGSCGRCNLQERTLDVVTRASKHASSFLKWAQPTRLASGDASSETKDAGTEIERKELEQELLKITRELAAFSKFPETFASNNWIECMKSAVGMKTTGDYLSLDMTETNLLTMLDDAFNALQRDEDERMGTRVEAVPYIEELGLMNDARKGFTKHLCRITNDRQRERNELIACVPVTSRLVTEIKKRRGSSDSANISEYQAKAVHPRFLVMDESHSSNFMTPNTTSPPVMTEAMELNEWIIAILSSLTTIQPSARLQSLLDEDPNAMEVQGKEKALPSLTNVIVPLVDRFLGRMQQAAGRGSRGGMPMTVNAEGQARTHHRTQDTQLWAAIVQLYYHSLESILFYEKGAASSTAVKNAPFHEALMACCYLCVARAVVITGKMQLVQPENHQVYCILPTVGSTSYSYLKVTESFLRALTSTIPGNERSKQLVETFGTLPRILQREVRNSEVHVIESLLWVRDNSRSLAEGCVVNIIAEVKQTSYWPPKCLEPTLPEEFEDGVGTANKEKPEPNHPEFAFVSFVMRKLLKIAYFRIQSICKALGIPAIYPVASQVWLAFRFLLRNQVELLYGRHVDQWILCTIYGICKIMKYQPDITFGKAIDAYTSLRGGELGISTCEAIVRHVKILDAAGDADDQESDQNYGSTKMGNIINLYNLVFVPLMKSYLLHSKALKRDAAMLRREMAARGKAGNKTAQSMDTSTSKSISEGNVTIQLCYGHTTTAAMMVDQEENNPTLQNILGASDNEPSDSTFLEFGRVSGAKRLSLTNERIQASGRR